MQPTSGVRGGPLPALQTGSQADHTRRLCDQIKTITDRCCKWKAPRRRPQGATRRVPAGQQEVEAVRADDIRAHRLGISGVPCFVVRGRHAMAGAQEPEVLARLLDVALVEG